MTANISTRRATLFVCLAYCWWGCSALFWRELASVAPLDQLSFRVIMAFAYLALVWVYRRRNPFQQLTAAHWKYGIVAALSIGTNWAVFLWAISNGQAVEASLGYFLMPLFAVALGVGLLGEKLRPLQLVALVLASVGIVWTLVVLGGIPWVSISLGITFALYGFARKQGPWQAVDGLTFETLLMLPVFIALLGWRGFSGMSIFGGAADGSLWVAGLILATGLVTIVPLLLFAAAAKRVSLSLVGLLQYINPTLQFLVGWRIFGEDVSAGRLIGFGWIWAALGLVVVDQLSSKRPVDGGTASSDEGVVGLREGLGAEKPTVR